MSRRSGGVALVAVLWGVLLLAVIAAGVTALVRTENARAGLDMDRAKLQTVVDSARVLIVQRLFDPKPERRPPLDGSATSLEWDGETVNVALTLESGRIDLNAASYEMLVVLGEASGLDSRQSNAWVAKLRDWQDTDDARQQDGAESAEYRALGTSYGPRNAPLKSIRELRMLFGMSDELYRCLAGSTTVYTESPAPDVAHLAPLVAVALSKLDKSVPSALPAAAAEIPPNAGSIDVSGQVIRMDVNIARSNLSRHDVIVGRVQTSGVSKLNPFGFGFNRLTPQQRFACSRTRVTNGFLPTTPVLSDQRWGDAVTDCRSRISGISGWSLIVVSVLSLWASACLSQSASVTYTYDDAGRLKSATYDDGSGTAYTLDAAGNRTLVTKTGAVPPGAPGIPVVSSIAQTTATATWAAAPGAVTAYEYSLNGGATWTSVGPSLTTPITGLVAGTAYAIQVHAINTAGAGPASSLTSFTTQTGTPGALTFSAITTSSVTVSWGAAAGPVASYAYSLTGGASWTNVGTVLSTPVSGLNSATAYNFLVEAIGAAGAGPTTAGTTYTLPGLPGVPSVSAITSNTATISWTAASGVISRYEYSLNSGSTWTSVGTALTANLTGLTGGTAYTALVRAVNLSGAGAASSTGFTTLSSYQITDSGGSVLAAASSLYSSAQTCNVVLGINLCNWSVSQKYGSHLVVASVTKAGSACPSGSTATLATGYTRPSTSSCEIDATSAAYGH